MLKYLDDLSDSPTAVRGPEGHDVNVGAKQPTKRSETRAAILVVDDHAIVRDGLRALISQEPDLVVVGEAETAADALRQVRAHRPALVIVDLALGDDSGLTLLREIRKVHADSRILAFSMYDERIFAQRALQGGANGYVGKHEDREVILGAIRRVLSGKTYVSEAVSELLLMSLSQTRRAATAPGLAELSERELEVLRLLAGGKKTGEISDVLGISAKTVETHRARMKEKLGLRSANELLVVAVNLLRDGFFQK